MKADRSRPPSRARRIFRGCRISVLLLLAAFMSIVLWSNYVQVPGFIASIVRNELRQNNVSLDFTRVRLSGFRRLIAEQLSIMPAATTNESQVQISQAELVLGYGGELRHPVAIRGLRLNGGQLSVAINEAGTPARYFSITNLQAEVEFKRDDTLRIVELSGQAFGARADLSGSLRHFSQFRLAEAPLGQGARQWRNQLAEVMNITEQLTFATPPELTLSFSADAADLSHTRASMSVRADEGVSRWGGFRRLRLNSTVLPLTNEPSLKGSFSFDLADLGSDSINLATFHLAAETIWSGDMQQLLTNYVTASVSTASTKWFSAPDLFAEFRSAPQKGLISSRFSVRSSDVSFGETELREAHLDGKLDHPLPFATPASWLGAILSSVPRSETNRTEQQISGEWSFQSTHSRLPRADVEFVNASGEITAKGVAAPSDASLSFWEFLEPYQVPWQLQLSNLTAGEVQIGTLRGGGHWDFPELEVAELSADLYGGKLKGHAALDVLTRKCTTSLESSFDYHQMGGLFEPVVQGWLAQFGWENPPALRADIALQLPPWTNTWDHLERTLPAGLTVDGHFEGRGSFRGVPLGLAESHFTFTNFIWRLSDLKITRPEGSALVRYTGNLTNQEISAVIESQIDPTILAKAFDKSLQPAFQMVRFTTPPLIRAEIRGDLDDLASLSARGRVSITNFFAREQAITDLRTDFAYTNQMIDITDLVAHRGKEEVRAPFSRIDIPAEVMFVTNAVSTIDPYIAMSLVGDDAYDAIDPYRFANSPTVTVNGLVPLRHVTTANLHFGVSGTDFTYWRFHLAALTGDVYWKGHELSFSNVHGAFYNGSADWSGYFRIDDKTDTARFSFHGIARNASLQPLVRDLFDTTNRLEGTFTGDLVITSANTASMQSWNGYGHATLKDGYLWSVPIFGTFSPALDKITPELGSNPISSGGGNFAVTNSVIFTRDMQVRAPAFRLDYKGNVDLEGRLDARVDAELLRDTWVVGKLFSKALWPVSKVFEARVSGTLNDPKTKFRYVPNIVFAPFKILGAIGEAAKKREPKNNGTPVSTNSPPPLP